MRSRLALAGALAFCSLRAGAQSAPSGLRKGPAPDLTYFCSLSADAAQAGFMAFTLPSPQGATLQFSRSKIPISAGPNVSRDAVAKADELLAGMLAQSAPTIPSALARNRVVLVVVPRDAKLTDLPEFALLRGVKLPDGRVWDNVRGVGFLSQKDGSVTAAVGEENLLADAAPDGYPKGYLVAHEFSHAVHGFGLDDALVGRIARGFQRRTAARRPFPSRYAGTTEYEYFAVSAGLFFGYGLDGPDPERSWAWLVRADDFMAGAVRAAYGLERSLWPRPQFVVSGGRQGSWGQ